MLGKIACTICQSLVRERGILGSLRAPGPGKLRALLQVRDLVEVRGSGHARLLLLIAMD